MRNVFRLFVGDLKRLSRNTVTIITVIGLVVIPSIFSWYNVLACWNVFDNTGNLKVAVANSDEGYQSDLVPMKINMGDEVVSALRANDQLDWVITDEQDAIDGTMAGRYYAAVVIPEQFSRDMMSFYSSDVEHATLVYYTNEKKNAIAPKVTDQGADRVSIQVNQVFTETLAEVALGLSSSLFDYAETSDAQGKIAELANHVEALSGTMRQTASTLRTYGALLDSTQSLVGSSGKLLSQTRVSADEVVGSASQMKQSATDAASAMDGAVARLVQAAAAQMERATSIEAAVDGALADAGSVSGDAAALIDDAAMIVEAAGDAERAQALRQSAQNVRDSSQSVQAAGDEARQLVQSAKEKLGDAHGNLDADLQPTLESLSTIVADAGETLSATASVLDTAGADLANASDSLSVRLAAAKGDLDGAAASLEASASKLSRLSEALNEALASDNLEMLRQVVGSDPSALAVALTSPVALERHAVYPVENFGSAMSPLYTTLALWVGALLLMVTLQVVPSRAALEELDRPTARQAFLGRFGVVSLVSLAQSTCVSVGNMVFLGVQVAHPFLYLLCFWVAGLCFAFMIYTLVVLFANLGKAIGVVLLILQVTGGGGSFPLKLLPQFVQTLSPYLPISHAVNAMRAAMFGVYQGDFWIELGVLVAFTVPFLLLGLVLNGPLSKVVPKFVEKVESTKVM